MTSRKFFVFFGLGLIATQTVSAQIVPPLPPPPIQIPAPVQFLAKLDPVLQLRTLLTGQSRIVARAVNAVTASGALYFASAGNAGNKDNQQGGVWEGDFADGGQVAAPIQGGGRVHSFGPSN